MTLLDAAIFMVHTIARDGATPRFGRWQPAALDCLGLLNGDPSFEDEKPGRPIALRVTVFLGWLARQGDVERKMSDALIDRLCEIRREIECNG